MFGEVMMMPRVVLRWQRSGDGEADAEEGSRLLSHQPSTLAQCEVPSNVPGMGSRVSPVMSWDVWMKEACGRTSEVFMELYGCDFTFSKPGRTRAPYRTGASGWEICI